MPILERLVGSSASDLYEAIFDVEINEEYDLFHDSDGEGPPPAPSTHVSRASSPTRRGGRIRSLSRRRRTVSVPHSPTSAGVSNRSPRASPYNRNVALPALLEPSASGEVQTVGPRSPLNRLFNHRRDFSASQERLMPSVSMDGIKKLESMVDDIRSLPVNKLKEEMKELQVCGAPSSVPRP